MLRVYYIFVISKRTLTKINFIVKVLSFHKKIHISRLLGIEQVQVIIHKCGFSGIDQVIVNNLTDKLVAIYHAHHILYTFFCQDKQITNCYTMANRLAYTRHLVLVRYTQMTLRLKYKSFESHLSKISNYLNFKQATNPCCSVFFYIYNLCVPWQEHRKVK